VDEVPQKLKLNFFVKLFVKLHIIFVSKYNKQQLDKIKLAAKYTFKTYFSLPIFQALKYNKYVIRHPLSLGT